MCKSFVTNGKVELFTAFLLFAFAIAWPWEIFQRLPGVPLTLCKAVGVLLIAIAVFQLYHRRREGFRFPWTGLEAPMAFFAIACLQSATHSLDPAASWAMLAQYAQYIILFYAFVILTPSLVTARWTGLAFATSAIGVAVLAIVCARGWAYPVSLLATNPLGRYTDAVFRASASVRVAATTVDFNGGVFPMLLAVPLLACAPLKGWRRFPLLLPMGLIGAGILLSFSRSTLLLYTALVLTGLALSAKGDRTRRVLFGGRIRIILMAAAGVLLLGFLAWFAYPYAHALMKRMASGISTRNASYASRWYGFQLAASLMPRYGLLGCGLDTTDIALAAVDTPGRLQGVTLHSVPFKFLLETGILGLVAYIWLWIRAARLVWRGFIRQEGDEGVGERRRMGVALLGVFFACFGVLAVQPFTALSLFPFLFGLAFGPIAARRRALPETSPAIALGPPLSIAVALAAIVIIPNLAYYQGAAQRVVKCADTLNAALEAESRGDWPLAAERYAKARANAEGNAPGHFQGGRPLERLRYFPEAMGVADYGFLRRNTFLDQDEGSPSLLCLYGQGRVAYAMGDFPEAAARFEEALRITPANPTLTKALDLTRR